MQNGRASKLFDRTAAGEEGPARAAWGTSATFGADEWPRSEGQKYFNARWLDTSTGRFISEDPVLDGTLWYAYVANNPMTMLDPTGLFEWGYDEGTGKYYALAQEGDSLTKLSYEYFGDSELYGQLAQHNNLRDADQIKIGQRLALPFDQLDARLTNPQKAYSVARQAEMFSDYLRNRSGATSIPMRELMSPAVVAGIFYGTGTKPANAAVTSRVQSAVGPIARAGIGALGANLADTMGDTQLIVPSGSDWSNMMAIMARLGSAGANADMMVGAMGMIVANPARFTGTGLRTEVGGHNPAAQKTAALLMHEYVHIFQAVGVAGSPLSPRLPPLSTGGSFLYRYAKEVLRVGYAGSMHENEAYAIGPWSSSALGDPSIPWQWW